MTRILVYSIILGLIGCKEPLSYKKTTDYQQKKIPNDGHNSVLSDSLESLNILFIGNSLTYYNNMPEMFGKMAEASGKSVNIESATIGGIALRHLIGRSRIIEKIKSKYWDFIILQSDDISAFPDMYDIEIVTLQRFKNVIFDNCSNTKIIYLMVWGLRNGVNIQELNGEFVYYSYLDYINKIYNGTLYIADETDLIISPVGWAWKEVRNQYPEIELFSSDNAHPGYNGSYLCAAVHYSIIFQESSVNVDYNGNLSESTAKILRNCASSVVLDSLNVWNIFVSTGIDK